MGIVDENDAICIVRSCIYDVYKGGLCHAHYDEYEDLLEVEPDVSLPTDP